MVTRIRVIHQCCLVLRSCVYLKDDSLVDGELCDDVREEEMSVVFSGRVDATLG